jgi:hypothetical protein
LQIVQLARAQHGAALLRKVVAAVNDAKPAAVVPGEDPRLTNPLREGASAGAAYSASLLAEAL